MKLEDVRNVARSKGLKGYFLSLYQHALEAMDCLSPEDIDNIFRSRKYGDGGYEKVPGIAMYADIDGLVYAIWFEGKDGGTEITPDVMYGVIGPEEDQSYQVDVAFDYRGLKMIIYFDDRDDQIAFEAYFDSKDENYDFLASLTDDQFLKVIFGKYLVKNEGYVEDKKGYYEDNIVSFTVLNQFFHD